MEALSSNHPNSPTIMLLSLKAGGLGINLTRANRVYLMDPVSNLIALILYHFKIIIFHSPTNCGENPCLLQVSATCMTYT